MTELVFSANIVLPLLILIATGYFAKRLGLIDDRFVGAGNKLVFKIFLPVLLCYNIMTTDSGFELGSRAFWIFPIFILAEFALCFLIVPKIEKDGKKASVMIQAICRSNYALFGIPLVELMYPERNTSLAALLVIVIVPMFNVFSVVTLESFSGGKRSFKKIAMGVITNPLIIGSAIGFVLWKTGVGALMPAFVMTSMKNIGSIASPLALFLLGGTLTIKTARENKRQLTIAVLGRLVIMPAIFLLLCILLGMRDVELACALIVFGAPVAVSSFPMAQLMGADGELAGELVAFTSAFSILSVFVFIYVMRVLAFL
ncbi:MAG: AEC family transporter [Eubacteriales bacterium]|nr:AEC family transporter [Eubacteriales bacterium]MDD3880648.1 AEC family transporter [Eubacteriales bacterium]MDD4513553.1 AEC family transporter [Eubacteriales bacterium]